MTATLADRPDVGTRSSSSAAPGSRPETARPQRGSPLQFLANTAPGIFSVGSVPGLGLTLELFLVGGEHTEEMCARCPLRNGCSIRRQ